ncbi:MAG: HAD family acid phosphatase [Legionellaceae bacterium]|nr:HAD family acid phosphatase [Legionellaceae bacterium]
MNKRMLAQSLLAATSLFFISTTSFAEPQNLDSLKTELRSYHDTGAYDKELAQVVKQAEAYIHAKVEANNKAEKPARLALVLDIDETTLSNYQGIIKRKFCEDMKLINRDINKAKAPAIAPMLALYNDAKKQHVAIFFVTGRRPNFQRPTEKNLKRAGYTSWHGLYFRPTQDQNLSVIPYKTQVRSNITQGGYTIIASIGDQASDLTGGYAEKTFKLPNPYYHLP